MDLCAAPLILTPRKSGQRKNPFRMRSVHELAFTPEVQAGVGKAQNRWHPHCIFGHSRTVAHIASMIWNDPMLTAGAWLHDIGKSEVRKQKLDPRGNPLFLRPGVPEYTFPRHEKAGMELIMKMPDYIFQDLNLDKAALANLVGAHYLPMRLVQKWRKLGERGKCLDAINVFKEKVQERGVEMEMLANLFYADRASTWSRASDADFFVAFWNHLTGGRPNESTLYEIFMRVEERTRRKEMKAPGGD